MCVCMCVHRPTSGVAITIGWRVMFPNRLTRSRWWRSPTIMSLLTMRCCNRRQRSADRPRTACGSLRHGLSTGRRHGGGNSSLRSIAALNMTSSMESLYQNRWIASSIFNNGHVYTKNYKRHTCIQYGMFPYLRVLTYLSRHLCWNPPLACSPGMPALIPCSVINISCLRETPVRHEIRQTTRSHGHGRILAIKLSNIFAERRCLQNNKLQECLLAKTRSYLSHTYPLGGIACSD